MLIIVSPVGLVNCQCPLLVYDTDDSTLEWHTTDNIKMAISAGLDILNATVSYTEGYLHVSGCSTDFIFDSYKMKMDGVLYKSIFVEDEGYYDIFIRGGSDCFAFLEGEYGADFPVSWGLDDGCNYIVTPPVHINGSFGFYIVGEIMNNDAELSYQWHDFATSPLVIHSKEICSKIIKMLLLSKGTDAEIAVLKMLGFLREGGI